MDSHEEDNKTASERLTGVPAGEGRIYGSRDEREGADAGNTGTPQQSNTESDVGHASTKGLVSATGSQACFFWKRSSSGEEDPSTESVKRN